MVGHEAAGKIESFVAVVSHLILCDNQELPPRRLTAQCGQPTPLLGNNVLTVVDP